jgi:hypothetical protein
MTAAERMGRGLVALAIAATAATIGAPASATTLVRQSLDELVANNSTVVVGEVLDVRSYWNDEHTFILSDVTFAATEVLKGRTKPQEITITVMGGSVGDLSTVIVGGAELVPGNAYVLFLGRNDLPGVPSALTVRDHSQGAFDLVVSPKGEMRAVSQAHRHPLLPDMLGEAEAPGGTFGLSFDAMTRSIRAIASRPEEAN